MNPILILGGLLGGGYAASRLLKKPAQVQTVMGAGGVPVQIVTPLATPTPAQVSGTRPPATGHLVVHPNGNVQPAPIVITPTGAASINVSSVKDVQHALNTLGYQPLLTEDGKLGPKTAANVRAFQGKSSLVVDGNAGPATKAALSKALVGLASGGTAPAVTAAIAAAPAHEKLQYNDNWAAPKTPPTAAQQTSSSTMGLRDIQRALNLLGASPPLVEDGKSGPKTVAAIKSFQLGHGQNADGVAGPATKALLYQLEHAPVKQFTGEGQFSGRFC